MSDSSDYGFCDGDSNLKKIRIRIFKNAESVRSFFKGFKKVPKEFKCGRCDTGLWGAVFYNKNVTIITKFVTNITSLILEKQWRNNGKVMVEQPALKKIRGYGLPRIFSC